MVEERQAETRRECLDKDTKMVDAGEAAGRGREEGGGRRGERGERAVRRCIESPGS